VKGTSAISKILSRYRSSSETFVCVTKSEPHLGLSITMIDSIDKAVGAQCISKLGIKLLASFRCVGFGEVDDSQVREFHYIPSR